VPTIHKNEVSSFIDSLTARPGDYEVSKGVTLETLDLEKEPEVQTDKDAVKLVACRECGRPLVTTTFFAAAKGICRVCRGEGSEVASVAVAQPGKTEPAKATNLVDVLINKHFANALCPVHPDDPDHAMELKYVDQNDNYGPSEHIGFKDGKPVYRQLAKGETVLHQCLACKAIVTYSTTAQSQYRRVNEPTANRKRSRMGESLGTRDEVPHAA
jgi:hypothetical protein